MRIGMLFANLNVLVILLAGGFSLGQDSAVSVTANWQAVERVSQTVPTTQHLANAFTLRSSPLNKRLLEDLRNLHTNDTRLQLWFSVPRQVVPELNAPTATETFWDFTYIDPVVEDYFANTSGRHNVNIGTIPRWMFKVPPIDLPTDPAASLYAYTRDTNGDLLKDPTGRQFGEYQARIFSWYTQGGFTDELGRLHKSSYHYKIDYWGVMNEQSIENHLSIEQYTRLYDQTVIAIRKIDPQVQFIAPEFAGIKDLNEAERYFLDPRNHDPAALPVEWFAFHNYVMATDDPSTWQEAFFTGKGNPFGATVASFDGVLRQVIEIRDQLSPKTKIAIDELGTFDTINPIDPAHFDMENNPATTAAPYSAYSPLYWVASGGNWAANFLTAERLGVPIFSMTQMVGAPTQSESCSMINWDTAQPNAHYWVLSLISHNFGPGDKLYPTESSVSDVLAQASLTSTGRKLLVINTSNRAVDVQLQAAFAKSDLRAEVVDQQSGESAPRKERVSGGRIGLAPFAVAVISEK
jgi:hypothetical protein